MTLIKILKAQAFNAAILVLEDESTDKGSRTEDDHGNEEEPGWVQPQEEAVSPRWSCLRVEG